MCVPHAAQFALARGEEVHSLRCVGAQKLSWTDKECRLLLLNCFRSRRLYLPGPQRNNSTTLIKYFYKNLKAIYNTPPPPMTLKVLYVHACVCMIESEGPRTTAAAGLITIMLPSVVCRHVFFILLRMNLIDSGWKFCVCFFKHVH